MKDSEAWICLYVKTPQDGKFPQYPLCKKVGLTIEGQHTPTGYRRHEKCPLKNATNGYCQVTDIKLFESLTSTR